MNHVWDVVVGQMFEKRKIEVQGRFALEILETLVALLTDFPYEFLYEIQQKNSPYMVV
mgnify:CR=1 FL=1